MHHVREEAIRTCQLPLQPDRETNDARRWRAAAIAAGGLVPAEVVIPECVDGALCTLLYETDSQERLHLLFATGRGEFVDLPKEGGGELSGWYGGDQAWRSWYSKERIVDAEDFAHIAAEWGTENIPDDPAPILDELPMPRRAIEELGILLVRHVRDVAIQSCDLQLLPHSETPMAKRWRRAAIPFNGNVPPEVLIPDCVDETIFTFLRAIDRGLLPLLFVATEGEVVDLVKDGGGKLSMRYIENGGWRDAFAKERVGEDAD